MIKIHKTKNESSKLIQYFLFSYFYYTLFILRYSEMKNMISNETL